MDHRTKKRVLMISWTPFGHIIPLLELAKNVSKFHKVTFTVSALRVDEIKKRELISGHEDITIFPVNDGYRDEDFPDIHGLQSFLASIRFCVQPIKGLVDSLGEQGKNLPQQLKNVDVIIVDSFMAKGVANSTTNKIPFYHFTTGSAGSNSIFCCPGEPDKNLLPFNWTEFLLQLQGTFSLAAGVIANSVRELEEHEMQVVKSHPSMSNSEYFFVGPLIPEEKQDVSKLQQQQLVSDWLDHKGRSSVLYVSFGSIATPTEGQITELAKAFLLLKKPVICSLSKGHQKFLPSEIREKIETQFQNMHEDILILSWAPQKIILNHPSTAVFLSHCGWNSSLESISAGVPVVGWPMFADQPDNAHFMVRQGVGVLVEGTGMTPKRIVVAAEIAELINQVAGWSSPRSKIDYQQNSKALAEKVCGALRSPDGSSFKDFHKLMALL